jgi:hypothetical protein
MFNFYISFGTLKKRYIFVAYKQTNTYIMKNYRNKEVKLVSNETGKEVKVGDQITTFRGEVETLQNMRPPHKSSSSGYVNNYYATVYDCKFVEIN